VERKSRWGPDLEFGEALFVLLMDGQDGPPGALHKALQAPPREGLPRGPRMRSPRVSRWGLDAPGRAAHHTRARDTLWHCHCARAWRNPWVA